MTNLKKANGQVHSKKVEREYFNLQLLLKIFCRWLNGNRFLAFPAKATVAREWISRQKQGLRPWREFLRSDKFKIPTGPGVVGRRMFGNLVGFQANYLCIFLVLAAYCLITTPLLLLAIAASIGFVYILRAKSSEGRLVIAGKEIPPAMQYGAGICMSLPLLYISGAGTALFWTIGATVVVVLAHALFYASEPRPGAEFEMEQV